MERRTPGPGYGGRGRSRPRYPPAKFPSNPGNYQNFHSSRHDPSTSSNSVGSDKISDDKNRSSPSNDSISSLVGTCPFMCPDAERMQRERLRDLAVFERLHGDPSRTSSSLAVKKFCRTISGNNAKASDLRPLPVLEETLKYVLSLLDSVDQPYEVIHDFIFDRTRSIRQDLSIQSIVSDRAICMYEEMVRFHIVAHRKLCIYSGNPNISSLRHLNMEQLTKALTSLYNLYDINRNPKSTYWNEAEFRSFYVLLHLDSASQPMGESLALWFRKVSPITIKSKEMSFARRLLRSFRVGNYKQFFGATAAEASYLQYCIIEPYINEVRAFAISCINHCGYKLHPYPIERLSKILMMTDSETESFCIACGLEIEMNDAGSKFLTTKQISFTRPKEGFQNYSFPGCKYER